MNFATNQEEDDDADTASNTTRFASEMPQDKRLHPKPTRSKSAMVVTSPRRIRKAVAKGEEIDYLFNFCEDQNDLALTRHEAQSWPTVPQAQHTTTHSVLHALAHTVYHMSLLTNDAKYCQSIEVIFFC
jgi:hypothetical protein